MAEFESVVEWGLGGAAVAGDLVEASGVEESESSSCEDFVGVALVADVENELIFRGVEDAMERDCGLYKAEIGTYVSAMEGDPVEDGLPYLVGEGGEVGRVEGFEVGG